MLPKGVRGLFGFLIASLEDLNDKSSSLCYGSLHGDLTGGRRVN